MTSTRRPAKNQQGTQEIESVKESINDIINQLQDIDPSRLSFSPFLDLDTQISLAPVSDSPESSVEELHSPAHSIPGSQLCLPSKVAEDMSGSHQASDSQRPHNPVNDRPVTVDLAPEFPADSTPERLHTQSAAHGPNGQPVGGANQWSPSVSDQLDSTIGEGHPLIQSPPMEAIELGLWTVAEQEPRDGALGLGPAEPKPGCCCCCRQTCCGASCSGCCSSGRVPALCSTVACLLCLPGLLYALYLYAPIEAPLCPDITSRMVFTLSCCAVASLPILVGVLIAGACRFFSGSLRPVVEKANAVALVQVFVVGSVVQLFLYILNLLVLATFLPQGQLRVIPILAAVFIGGRIIYWILLHTCSSWRVFGSGLTIFPLLAVLAFNILCMFDLGSRDLFFGSQDVYANDTSPSAWPHNISMSLGDT